MRMVFSGVLVCRTPRISSSSWSVVSLDADVVPIAEMFASGAVALPFAALAPEVVDAEAEFPEFEALGVVPAFEPELDAFDAVLPDDVAAVVDGCDPNPFELFPLPLFPGPMNFGTTEIEAVERLLELTPSEAINRNVSVPWKPLSGV
jgi:hypothetical protein